MSFTSTPACATALLALCLATGCFSNDDTATGKQLACSDDADCTPHGVGATCGSSSVCVDASGKPIAVTGAAGSGGNAGTNATGGAGGASAATGGTGGVCTGCCAGVPGACAGKACDCGPVAGTSATGGASATGGTGTTGGTGGTGDLCTDCCAGVPNPKCTSATCECMTGGSGGTGGNLCDDCCAGIPNPACATVDCACEPKTCMVGTDCDSDEVCVYSGGFTAMPGGTCQPNPCGTAALSCTCAESLCTVGSCSQAKDGVVTCVCPNC